MYQYKWMKTLIKIIRGINGGSGTSKESRVMNCLIKVFQKKKLYLILKLIFFISLYNALPLQKIKSLEMTTNTHMLIYVKSISMKNMPIFSRLRVEVTFISYDTCKHHKRFIQSTIYTIHLGIILGFFYCAYIIFLFVDIHTQHTTF